VLSRFTHRSCCSAHLVRPLGEEWCDGVIIAVKQEHKRTAAAAKVKHSNL